MVFAASHDTVLITDGGLATQLEARGHDLPDDLRRSIQAHAF